MTHLHKYPDLRILPLDRIFPHEEHDETRTPPLATRLQESRVLRNPPLVSPFPDNSEQYMVLDGANRVAAFKFLGFAHILAQVTDHTSSSIQLSTWNHVVWGMDAKELVDKLKAIRGLSVTRVENTAQEKMKNLVSLHAPGNQSVQLSTEETDFHKQVVLLHQIMDCYKSSARFDRTPLTKLDELTHLYENLTAVIVYPQFQIKELFSMCAAGELFPSGITRFSVAPRALRVNYPLDELADERPLEEKDSLLQEFLHHRIAGKGVRYYTEPTVLFDE